MDLANLVINVRDAEAIEKLNQLEQKLTGLQKTGSNVGKAFVAGWSFTKIMKGIKAVGDAYTEQIRTLNIFNQNFAATDKLVINSLSKLRNEFAMTDTQAKQLFGVVGSKLKFFEFDEKEMNKVTGDLSEMARKHRRLLWSK